MKPVNRFKQTKLAAFLKKALLYDVYKRDQFRKRRHERAARLSENGAPAKGLVMDKVDVVITTKCNLLCDGCSHLMPYYKKPSHLDRDRVVSSIRKLAD